ncbi:hypothetical protein PoB_006634100 [Plakobranchus ocellatus]|uniref:Uncharacterized protein n=1 Tax=Plakobranchus ocellatus TaxID=259542 RepID=A0AAV4D6N3_9GAST|nr:hypothetical protein PoB_006634100 [Plakobranchus ocellatus]
MVTCTQINSKGSEDKNNTANELSGIISAVEDVESENVQWNFSINEIFIAPIPQPRQLRPTRSCTTSHRLLTSVDILREKREKQLAKEKAELEKQARERPRAEKKKSKSGVEPQEMALKVQETAAKERNDKKQVDSGDQAEKDAQTETVANKNVEKAMETLGLFLQQYKKERAAFFPSSLHLRLPLAN